MNSTQKCFNYLHFFLYLLLPTLILTGAGDISAKIVKGRMLEKISRSPVANGTVMLFEGKTIIAAAFTDTLGFFFIDKLEAEKIIVRARKMGYNEVAVGPLRMPKSDTLKIVLEMESNPQVMDEVVVSDKKVEEFLVKNGFYERMKSEVGQFFTPADIQHVNASNAGDLLRKITTNFITNGDRGGMSFESMRMLGYGLKNSKVINGPSSTTSSTVIVYMDGFPINPEFLGSFSSNDIAAIELYSSGTSTPAKYGGGHRAAATILIWTKR
jgi:hypothetical protein